MSNLTNLMDLLETELSSEIQHNIYGQSRVLSISTQTSLGLGGKSLPILGGVKAGIVGERGGTKKVSEISTSSLKIDAVEFAVIVPFSKDLTKVKGFEKDVASLVSVSAIDAIAEAVDHTIFTGVDPYSAAAPANFGTFEGLQEVSIYSKADFYSALQQTTADGRTADHVILSTALVHELLGRTGLVTVSDPSNNGANWQGNTNINIQGNTNGGTIEGLPYVTFPSTQKVGYLGSFGAGSRFGVVGGKLDFDLLKEAYLPGTEINLATDNMLAVRVSGLFGFNYFTEDNFVQLTTRDTPILPGS